MNIELGALIILGITNLGTLAYLFYSQREESKQKQKLINSLVAKNSQDFSNFELADKMEKVPVQPQTDLREDLQELSDLTDEQFDEKIVSS